MKTLFRLVRNAVIAFLVFWFVVVVGVASIGGTGKTWSYLSGYTDYDVSKIPDLSDKYVLITGGSRGLGLASAEMLAAKNAHVYITGRELEAAKVAAQALNDKIKPKFPIVGMEMDLSDHLSILKFSRDYRALKVPLNIFITNAAAQAKSFQGTKDGFEMSLGSNWLGHFYLQQLLKDLIEASAPSRIVIVSSGSHTTGHNGVPENDDFIYFKEENRKDFEMMRNYGLSKFMNVQHAFELRRQYSNQNSKKVTAVAMDPGIVRTDMASEAIEDFVKTAPAIVRPFVRLMFETARLDLFEPYQGALTVAYAALVEGDHPYVGPVARPRSMNSSWVSKAARDESGWLRTWKLGEGLISQWPKQ